MKLTLKRKFIAVLALTSLLGACSLFKNERRFEPAKLADIKQSIVVNTVWQTSIGSGGSAGFAPVYADNSIFAATPDGTVVRVNAENGNIAWSTKLDTKLTSGVGVGDGLVIVTDRKAKAYALNAQTGEKVWDTELSTISTMPPIAGFGKVIVRADDFRVQAFDSKDGKLHWSFVRTNPILSLKTNSRMALINNAVIVAVPTGKLVSLNLNDGTVNWEIHSASAKGPSDIDSVTDVVGQPLVFNDGVCTSSYQGNITCYSIKNSRLTPVWFEPFSSAVGLGYDNNIIYGASIDGTVAAFSLANGQIAWSDQTLKNRGLTNPVVYQNYLYVGDLDGLIHVYDTKSGSLVGRFSAGSSKDIVSPLLPTDKGVVVQNGSGTLMLIRAN